MSDHLRSRRWTLRTSIADIRMTCVLIAWSVWMGGLMFYFGIVVPVGGAIVGGSEQGFVTQQVTFRLNCIGIAALTVMVWNSWMVKSRLLWVTVLIMCLCHAALFVIHYQLGTLVDSASRQILNPSRFTSLHEAYEGVSTVQWIAAVAHLAGVVHNTKERSQS